MFVSGVSKWGYLGKVWFTISLNILIMKKNKAFKFRLKPTLEQQQYFQQCFGATRFIWNKMLGDRIEYYQEYKQALKNTPAMYKDEFTWLREVDSLALSNVQMQLQTAFKNFFTQPRVGYPNFKSKKHSRKTYTTNNINGSIRLEGKYIKLPKIGLVEIILHRQIPKNCWIKSVTISQASTDKYYVSILTDYEVEDSEVKLDKSKSIGLDYSSPCFYIDSNGNEAGYPRYFRYYADLLAKEQRKLSRMKLGSNNYHTQKIKVAKIHEKIANSRNNWLHNLSKNLCDTYHYICIEDLDMKSLSQCLTLGKSTMDNGFGIFRAYLQYKQDDKNHKLIKIDKWYPSSKTCNNCGYVNKDLKLSDREWICPECGCIIERDKNAAKNILEVGLSLV